jgi:hypothetical protein
MAEDRNPAPTQVEIKYEEIRAPRIEEILFPPGLVRRIGWLAPGLLSVLASLGSEFFVQSVNSTPATRVTKYP